MARRRRRKSIGQIDAERRLQVVQNQNDSFRDDLIAASTEHKRQEATIIDLRAQLQHVRAVADDKRAENTMLHGINEKLAGHNVVLLSDRDRLTAAIEVMSRRHASPSAEKDPRRGGWRASDSLRELNQRAIAPALQPASASHD